MTSSAQDATTTPLPTAKSITALLGQLWINFDESLSNAELKAAVGALLDAFADSDFKPALGIHPANHFIAMTCPQDVITAGVTLCRVQTVFAPRIPYTAWSNVAQIAANMVRVRSVFLDPTLYEQGIIDDMLATLRQQDVVMDISMDATVVEVVFRGSLTQEADRDKIAAVLAEAGVAVNIQESSLAGQLTQLFS